MREIEKILLVSVALSALPNVLALFKLTNAHCESLNQSIYTIQQCRLRAVKRDISVFNFNALVLMPINNITLNGQLLRKYSGYKPFIVNFTIDTCAFLRRRNNPMAKAAYALFKDFSNLNHTCPYQGEIFVKDFYPKHELFKVPLPAADYALFLTFYFYNVKTVIINVYFSFAND